MTGDYRYVRRASFETGKIDDWAVTDDRVAMLAGSTVYLIGEGRDRFDLEEPASGVGLNDKLYVHGAGTVRAFSVSGTRLWTAEIDGAEALAAPDDSDFVVVLTGDDRLLGLDAVAGHRRFERDRPDSDVATTSEMVCTSDSLVVAAWSFLSVLDPTGDKRFRKTLDGAIKGVGVVDGTIVCVMKDDRLIGIDAETGDELWCHEWTVDRIDPFGRGELLVATDEGIRLVAPDGEWSATALDDGLPVAAARGDPVCVVVDSLVNVYGRADPGGAEVTATVRADVVEPTAGTVPVEVENAGDTPSVATVSVAVDGATVQSGPERLTLTPGESERIRAVLSDIEEDELNVEVRVEGDVSADAVVPVAGGVDALRTEASPAAIEPGGSAVEVAVENTATVPIRDVELLPSGRSRDGLDPGERWTTVVPLPESGPIVLTTPAGERTVNVDVPDRPLGAEVEFRDGLVVVGVSNGASARVVDDVTVASDALPRELEHPFKGGANSRLVVAAPPVDDGEATVRVESRLLSHTATVDVPADAVVGRPDPGRVGPAGSRGGADLNSSAASQAGGDPANTAAAAVRAADEGGGDGGEFPLDLDRRFEPEDPDIGEIQFEYVDVKNAGSEPKRVAVVPAEGGGATETLQPEEVCTFVRAHVFSDDSRVPAVSVETDGDDRTADPVEQSPDASDWYCLATIVPSRADQELRLELVNRSRTRLAFTDLSLRSFSLAEPFEEVEVQPRSTREVSVPIDGPPAAEWSEPALLSFSAGSDVAAATARQTLVHAAAVGDRELADLSVAVSEETVLDGGSGTVVVEVVNDGAATVDGLSVEAGGDQLRTILYDALTGESLSPGESLTHYVDVVDIDDELDVPVTLAVDDGLEETVRVVADESDENAVRIDRPELADPADVSPPERISTSFSVEPDDADPR